MATPIGHALAGLAVASLARLANSRPVEAPICPTSIGVQVRHILQVRGVSVMLAVVMAMAPDLDLIPGMVQGQPVRYHGGISHSLGCGILLSLLAAGLWRMARLPNNLPTRMVFTISMLAFASHLLLDMMGPDGREPFGIPLLWPLSDARYLTPRPILFGVHHASTTTAGFGEFLSGVFSWPNMIAILWECVLTMPLIVFGEWLSCRHQNLRKSVV